VIIQFYFIPDRPQEITLVVTEWQDGLASNLLSTIDASSHPFCKVILMVPHNMARHDINALSSIQTSIDVSIEKRNTDFMDICNAPVNTEYFMITNSYHVVSEQVDLLFTNDSRRLPVIPFTQADNSYCLDSEPCVKAYEKSQQFDKQNKIIVQDFDMLFRTDLRDEFCSIWRQRYEHEAVPPGDIGIQDSLGPMEPPTATTYTSFLSMRGKLGKFYTFTDQGRRNIFERVISVDEEKAATYYDETVLANYLMREDIIKDNIMTNTETYQLKHKRYLELTPSFTPPVSPSFGAINDKMDQSEWRCGLSYADAADCNNISSCPGRADDDCPFGEYCLLVTSCGTNEEGGDTIHGWYCGYTYSDARTCDKDSSCSGGMDRECANGQYCLPDITCNDGNHGNDGKGELDDFDWHCGLTYSDATKCEQGSSCSGKLDSDCADGQRCFPITKCVLGSDKDKSVITDKDERASLIGADKVPSTKRKYFSLVIGFVIIFFIIYLAYTYIGHYNVDKTTTITGNFELPLLTKTIT